MSLRLLNLIYPQLMYKKSVETEICHILYMFILMSKYEAFLFRIVPVDYAIVFGGLRDVLSHLNPTGLTIWGHYWFLPSSVLVVCDIDAVATGKNFYCFPSKFIECHVLKPQSTAIFISVFVLWSCGWSDCCRSSHSVPKRSRIGNVVISEPMVVCG